MAELVGINPGDLTLFPHVHITEGKSLQAASH